MGKGYWKGEGRKYERGREKERKRGGEKKMKRKQSQTCVQEGFKHNDNTTGCIKDIRDHQRPAEGESVFIFPPIVGSTYLPSEDRPT